MAERGSMQVALLVVQNDLQLLRLCLESDLVPSGHYSLCSAPWLWETLLTERLVALSALGLGYCYSGANAALDTSLQGSTMAIGRRVSFRKINDCFWWRSWIMAVSATRCGSSLKYRPMPDYGNSDVHFSEKVIARIGNVSTAYQRGRRRTRRRRNEDDMNN